MQFILKVMNPFMPDENLHSEILDKFIDLNIKGGQMSSGAQKDGFLKYEKGKAVAAFDPQTKSYVSFADFSVKCDAALGEMPEGFMPWKTAIRNKNKEVIFSEFFANMKAMNSLGAQIAIKYGSNSNRIGKKLVSDGVAANTNDVNTVMLTGFFHAFGPVNNYFD